MTEYFLNHEGILIKAFTSNGKAIILIESIFGLLKMSSAARHEITKSHDWMPHY